MFFLVSRAPLPQRRKNMGTVRAQTQGEGKVDYFVWCIHKRTLLETKVVCVGNRGRPIGYKICREFSYFLSVGFEVFTAVVMKSIIFWDMTPCSPSSSNRRFGGTYRLHLATCLLAGFCWTYFFDPEDGGDMFLRNVGWNSTDHTASYPSRRYSSFPEWFTLKVILNKSASYRGKLAWNIIWYCRSKQRCYAVMLAQTAWVCYQINKINSLDIILKNNEVNIYLELWQRVLIIYHGFTST
jgi:hypothetical protein